MIVNQIIDCGDMLYRVLMRQEEQVEKKRRKRRWRGWSRSKRWMRRGRK